MKKLLVIILACVLAVPAHAALDAATVWEVRTAGADTNGGGYSGTTNTDMSIFDNKNAAGCTSCQSATVNISVTDGVTNGTTNITSTTANFSAAGGTDLRNNVIYVAGGTGSVAAAWYKVVSVTNSTTIVVDRATGLTAGTGVTINIGGALLSPAIAAASAIATNIIYIKNGTYSITSASSNVAGGVITSNVTSLWIGYSTNRTQTNTDTRPIIQTNVSTATQVTTNAATFYNINFDGNSQTAAKWNAGGAYAHVKVSGFNTASSGTSMCDYCEITGNSASMFLSGAGVVSNSEIHGNTATQLGFVLLRSLVYSNTGATTDGFSAAEAYGNVFYANGRDGLAAGANFGYWVNNVAEANVRYGLNPSSTIKVLENNFTYNNNGGTGNTQILLTAANPLVQIGSVNITAGSPFTNAAGGDFSLNSTANQGALVRAAGFPASYPLGTTASALDGGAAQHAGSSTVTIGVPVSQ